MSYEKLRAYFWIDPLICLATVLMGTLSLVASLFDRTGNKQMAVARAWARILCRLAGVQLRIVGLENIQPGSNYIITANHLSYMDTPVVLGHLPIDFRFMAKKGLFKIPFLGTHLASAGHLPVVNDNPRDGIKALNEGAKLIAARRISVLIFPEGGRAASGELQEFRDGAFFLAIKSGAPVLPVAICGTFEMLPFGSGFMKPGPITLRIGKPIETAGRHIKERTALSSQVRAEVDRLTHLGHQP
ncbi:MAG: 1-acyl-sn-glycerol-3-phosphate acyltransferase [Bryobacteraceae bacterium]|nr:1-acyl-sn-glycerol-3-phosphate acyltransferase [Bryobacteraceae bacterium]